MITQTYMQSLNALGTTIEIRLVETNSNKVEKWFSSLWNEVTQFEKTFSRFILKSELSLFNNKAGEKVIVSKMFMDILRKSKYYSEHTRGIFNPFVLPLLQKNGYIHSMTDFTNIAHDFSKRESVSFDKLRLGTDWAQIPNNTAVDLGGIGKGYLADHLASLLANHIENYSLSLGGDIFVKGKNESDNDWKIAIQDNENRTNDIAMYTYEKDTVGIATSATIRNKKGKTHKHIINTTNSQSPDTSFTMCTVASTDTTSADVFASCILIGGKALAEELLSKKNISGVLLQKGPNTKPEILGQGFTLL